MAEVVNPDIRGRPSRRRFQLWRMAHLLPRSSLQIFLPPYPLARVDWFKFPPWSNQPAGSVERGFRTAVPYREVPVVADPSLPNYFVTGSNSLLRSNPGIVGAPELGLLELWWGPAMTMFRRHLGTDGLKRSMPVPGPSIAVS